MAIIPTNLSLNASTSITSEYVGLFTLVFLPGHREIYYYKHCAKNEPNKLIIAPAKKIPKNLNIPSMLNVIV